MMISRRSSRNPCHPGSDRDLEGWNCGDTLMAKKKGIYWHLSINVGGLSVKEESGNKIADLCHLIQDCKADSTSISELGLNPRNLLKHKQWAERMLISFKNFMESK